MRSAPALVALTVATLLLVGCAAPTADDGRLTITASTSVYGDIAATVAGDGVEVSSIITSSAQDPHSYEVTARDRLALETADLVVFNGGGYDAFVETVLEAMDAAPATVDAADLAGVEGHDFGAEEGEHHEHENEHVWYDLHVMEEVASEIAVQLAELDPENAGSYAENASAFGEAVAGVETAVAALADRAAGVGAVVTEPVPSYLLAEAGVVDVTPEGFSEAIEEGTDVPPALLAEVLAAIASGEIAFVAHNPQTGSAETEEVVSAAEAAGIPIVSFSETLPDGDDYVSWMTANVDALSAALP